VVVTLCIATKLRGCLHCYETTWLWHSALLRNYVVVTLCIAVKLRLVAKSSLLRNMNRCTVDCYKQNYVYGYDTLYFKETAQLRRPVLLWNSIVATSSAAKNCMVVSKHSAIYEVGWVWHPTLERNYILATPFITTSLAAVKLQFWYPALLETAGMLHAKLL